jgi:drug/metabolite transporter (DMT)-like permease
MIMRPVMEGGLDPAVAGFYRTAVAVIVFHAVYPIEYYCGTVPKTYWPDRSLYGHILANGFFGMALGVALLMKALETGSVATVAILSSTSPLLILPIVWFQTKLMPSAAAWIGALLVVLCAVLLV